MRSRSGWTLASYSQSVFPDGSGVMLRTYKDPKTGKSFNLTVKWDSKGDPEELAWHGPKTLP